MRKKLLALALVFLCAHFCPLRVRRGGTGDESNAGTDCRADRRADCGTDGGADAQRHV